MSLKVINSEATCIKIKEIFEERGLTAKQVQRELQLDSVQAVYKWISPNCKTMPSLDNLVLLANLMDCTLEDIIVVNEITM